MKSVEEIYQELAGEFFRRTGLNAAGSGDLAVRFYAVAAQLYGLHLQADWTRRQCFPQTAEGEELDKHAVLRGLERRKPVRACGTVRFLLGEQRLGEAEIPAGTVCMTASGVRYRTVRGGTAGAEETAIDLPVEAVEAGSGGNAEAGQIVYLAVPPAGVVGCTNPERFTGGQDGEEDESLRSRILATYKRLANGANAAFYEQIALSHGGVAAVKVLPRNRGVGTVDVVIAAQGGMPSESLLDEVKAELDAMREIAVDVQAIAPTARAVNLTVSITAEEGYDKAELRERVQAALAEHFDGRLLGRGVVQAQLVALVYAIEGVSNCSVVISGGDVAANAVTLPVLGTLSLSAE